jgi:YVTN family beta-propeller protein
MNARVRNIGVALVAVLLLSIFPEQKLNAVNSSRYGGSIVVGVDESFTGFCTNNMPSDSSLWAHRTMFETLVERNSAGVLTGLLAQSITANSTNDVWTITLRSGITYHDGSNLDATNVALNLDAQRGALTSPPNRIGLSVSYFANVLDIEVINSLELRVTLERPQIDFEETLYNRGRGVMRSSAQLNSSTTCSTAPIGTGPFKISGTWSSSSLVVVRNASYWRVDPDSAAQLPYLNQITFNQITEGSQRSAALRMDSIDAAVFSGFTESTFVSDLREQSSLVQEYRSLSPRVNTMWLNAGKIGSPLQNLNARKALTAAIDPGRINSVRLGGVGKIPRSVFPANSELWTTNGLIKFDLQNARSYVAAFKADTGAQALEFSMPVNTRSSSQATARLLQEMWADAGITVNLIIQESALIVANTFRSSRVDGTLNSYDAVLFDLIAGGETVINLPSIMASVFPANTVTSLPSSFVSIFGSILGISHHGNSAIDAKIFEAQSQTIDGQAWKKYRESVQLFQQNAYAFPISETPVSYFTSRKLFGIGTQLLPNRDRGLFVHSWGFDWSVVYLSDTDLPIPPTPEDSSFTELAWTGGNPRGVLADSSGEFSHVVKTNEGSICKVVFSTGAETSCLDVGGRPQALVKVPNQAVGYFVDEQSRKLRRINLLSGSVTDVVTLAATPTGVTVNSDGSLAFVASPEQSKVYKVDLSTRQVTSQISIAGAPAGVALSPDDSALWVSLSAQNKLVRVSTFSDSVTHTVFVGDMPWGVTMSPSGRFVFVVNQNSGSISRVDVATKAVTNVLSAGVQPVAMSLSVDERRAYVANGFTNSIGVMQIPQEAPLAAPAQPSAPVVPEQQSAPTPGPIQQSPTGNPPASPSASPSPAEGQSGSPAARTPSSLSVTGTAVPIGRAPSKSLATSSAVAISTTKVTIGLIAPTSTSKTNQIIKYTVQLKPKGSGRVVTRTIAVSAGKTVKPVLTGKPGTSYRVVVIAFTKAGKKQTWNGPTVSIPKKK